MTELLTTARPPRQPLRHRLAERGIDYSLLLLVPAVAVIAGLFLYPFLYGISISFEPQAGGGALANYTSFFSDSYQFGSVLRTLRLALPVALVSVGLAAPLAYRCRRDFRGRRLVTLVVMLPITFGSILIAQGMPRVFSPYGWVNLLLKDIGLGAADLLYNYWGTFIAAVLTSLPLSFLLLMGFFGGIDRSLEHAAATLGAGRAARFWRIILPLAAPGLLTTFMLACVEAFAIFPSAILVGQPDNQTHVLTIPIYQAASQNSDYTQASAIAVVLTVIELVILGLAVAVRGRLFTGSATGGKG
ncbi:ABC transporter permease subunit [Kutzneria sp. NPDC051319]|uniref:ABC transporter permease subunit n=1 Tax=Kutzneria sp. NPDC051319 TaxID=3155047 RepID=UPI00343E02F4